MKLIKVYVENFGKLNKFTYDFEDGLNIIEEDNGWGKSTLAAFIKAMFYGLEYTRGKKLNDRKLYSPWNGNKFGGYLIFEYEGREYKIERFFGNTPKHDLVKVYDMSKNTVTDELGDNPGQTIWEVDRDSYEKTAFISLDDSNLLNDIISSKLGNIEDGEADLETSSRAVELIDKAMVEIKARRGNGGLIGTKKTSLSKLKEELRSYKGSLEQAGETEAWIKIKEDQLREINSQISKIEEKQSKLVLYEKQQQYLNIENDVKNRQKDFDEAKEFFKGKVLSEEELSFIEAEAARYTNQKYQASKIKLSDIEARELEELNYKFNEDIPQAIEMDLYSDKINELSNKRTQLGKYTISSEEEKSFDLLDKKYRNMKIDTSTIDGYLDDLNRVSEISLEENRIKDDISKLKEKDINKKADKTKRIPKFSIGIIVFIIGLIATAISPTIGGIGVLIGIVEIINAIVYKAKNKAEDNPKRDNEIEVLEQELKDLENLKKEISMGYMSFIDSIDEKPTNIASFLVDSKIEITEYERLKRDIKDKREKTKEIEIKISALKEEIEGYLNKYYEQVEEKDYGKILSDLRDRNYRFQELSKAYDAYKETIEDIEKLKEKLEEELCYYYEEDPNDIASLVQDLSKKYYALDKVKNRLEDAKASKEDFESKNNIVELSKLDLSHRQDDKVLESLLEEKKTLNESKDESIKAIERHKKDIDRLIQEGDKIEDTESEIIQLETDIKELEEDHNLLNLTKESMLLAKESLAEKYMGDMSSNFKKYLKKLNNNKIDQYQVDINLDVKVEHEGELYNGSQLSRGMKDLVQLCLRMALVESVYKDVDNPILVLDDPFINLDNDRLINAIDLLKEISVDYQIIYFICHSSRSLEAIS